MRHQALPALSIQPKDDVPKVTENKRNQIVIAFFSLRNNSYLCDLS